MKQRHIIGCGIVFDMCQVIASVARLRAGWHAAASKLRGSLSLVKYNSRWMLRVSVKHMTIDVVSWHALRLLTYVEKSEPSAK